MDSLRVACVSISHNFQMNILFDLLKFSKFLFSNNNRNNLKMNFQKRKNIQK